MLWKNKLLILLLARDNAHEDCWKVIELLHNENPSQNELINASAKVGYNYHSMAVLADSIAATVKVAPHCYKLQTLQGHLKVNCPQKSFPQEMFQGWKVANASCNQCGKSRHATKVCKSKFHVNSQFLKNQRNGKLSTNRKHMMTQASSYPAVEAWVPNSELGQEDQLAWM